MAESLMHIELVSRLKKYVSNMIEEQYQSFIFTDISVDGENPPILITGNRPDLYYENNNKLVIGEAKTQKDISSKHSKEQYISYIKYCCAYRGDAILIIAVPWTEIAAIKSLLFKIMRENNCYCSLKVISNLD